MDTPASTPDDDPKDGEAGVTPGDAKGVPVPHEHAQPGSSQEFRAVDGVYTYPEKADEPDDGSLGRIE